MNNKDKKQLKGMASLMPSVVQIGKDGLSDAVIDSARAAITARELIKAHVLNNANLPTKETMEDLADMLGAELIQVIGHYGVLFKIRRLMGYVFLDAECFLRKNAGSGK